ncbi:MAG: hypothetical protein LBP93_06690, partial [Treponema sp.]|nr:hypothetical protein [Treponema sp.]
MKGPGKAFTAYPGYIAGSFTGTVRKLLGVRPDALFGTAAFTGPKEPACAGEMLPFFINTLSRAFQG